MSVCFNATLSKFKTLAKFYFCPFNFGFTTKWWHDYKNNEPLNFKNPERVIFFPCNLNLIIQKKPVVIDCTQKFKNPFVMKQNSFAVIQWVIVVDQSLIGMKHRLFVLKQNINELLHRGNEVLQRCEQLGISGGGIKTRNLSTC